MPTKRKLHKSWEEKWNKEFEMEQILIPITARKMKKFVKKELQEAERRVRKEISKIITEYEELNTDNMSGTFDYEEFGKRMVELNKLLKKV